MSFFPQDAAGWVGLLIELGGLFIAVALFVIRFIRQPLQEEAKRETARVDEKFKEHGERLGALNGTVRENAARIENVDRQAEKLHLQLTGQAEQAGRLEARMDQIQRTLDTYHSERMEEDRRLSVAMARIETKIEAGNASISMFDQLRVLLVRLNGQAEDKRG